MGYGAGGECDGGAGYVLGCSGEEGEEAGLVMREESCVDSFTVYQLSRAAVSLKGASDVALMAGSPVYSL